MFSYSFIVRIVCTLFYQGDIYIMTTKRTTAVSARKSTAKSAKTPLDFSSLFVEHSSEKAMDSQEFLSLIRKSSGVGNSEAKKYRTISPQTRP